MSSDSSSNSIKQYILSPTGIGLTIFICIWVVLELSQGHGLYVLFFFLLLATLSILRLKKFWILAAAILTVLMIRTPILTTFKVIGAYNIEAIQTIRPSISMLFTPEAGKRTLPDNIKQMLSLLEKNKITEYRIHKSAPEEDLLIVGAAWPIRNVSTSPYLLYRIDGNIDLAGCTKIDKRKKLALAYCP
jgi:hypothetical protein